MKSMLFKFNIVNMSTTDNPDFNIDNQLVSFPYLWHFKIPILPAFSVEYFSVQVRGYTSLSTNEKSIADDIVTIESASPMTLDNIEGVSVVVHYQGIRDYKLLFPWVSQVDLQRDLGLFYEEAEKNFDSGAWLSFALMCGAIFEGMLYAKLDYPSNNRFNNMIITASDEEHGILTTSQKEIMDKVRVLRNRIHCNKYHLPYVSRTDAMDIKSLLDRLIKDFSL
ncbi:DUF4145 domain-containing protein [Bacillus cereus group sp. BceL215]|uniref:DUF4145 domain-containing protein n=1 Tax=Bacillus cereus group sp. BceL215 TaxID=3445015 RepID=UPI003F289B78